jgi:hypothetical protein
MDAPKQTDAEIVAQYRQWQAEYDAIEASSGEWDMNRHDELWSWLFHDPQDARKAAFREIDRLTAENKEYVRQIECVSSTMAVDWDELINEGNDD